MNVFLQDLRYGLRVLRKSPGFAVLAVLTLALGIGANSTIFSWINSTVLNPIPGVQHSNEDTEVTTGGSRNYNPLAYPDYRDLRDQNRGFSSLIAMSLRAMSMTADGRPQRVWGTLVSANYFDALGVHPVLGRGFLPVEDTKPGGAPVAVISYRVWQTRFGGDPAIIGRKIQIDRHPYEIVGVAPPVFQGLQTGLRAEMWIPIAMTQQFFGVSRDLLTDRSARWLMVYGRLKSGVTLDEAQADANRVMQEITREYPDSHQGDFGVVVHPLWPAPFGANFYLRKILLLLMAGAGVVLLLPFANVANLRLVRAVGRRREMAIRMAMGASRGRLVRQLLAESVILSVSGGAVAMLLTYWTAGTLGNFVPPVAEIPIVMSASADRTVLTVTFLVSVVTGIVFGILPAFRTSGLRPAAVLKEEAGSMTGAVRKARLASGLVVAQVAMSLLLLVCAGLFIRSFRAAQKFNPGFNPHKVLLCSVDLHGLGYDKTTGITFDKQLLTILEAIPGAQSVTLADWIPLGFASSGVDVKPDGYIPREHESMTVGEASVGPNYLKTLQIPLIAGREFTARDAENSQRVAIVSQEFVKRYWPGQNGIGKRVQAERESYTVVGVAQNIDTERLGQKPEPFIYLPLFEDYSSAIAIHLRVAGDPLATYSAVERAVHSLDADVPLFDTTTLDSRLLLNTTTQRLASAFIGCFGVLAMVLAAVGIYGVLSYVTRQRRHEIGVRMALGAKPGDVLRLVLRQGLTLAVLGLITGLAASLLLTRAISSQLFGVQASDPLTYTGVAALLLGVALLAGYVPARRAINVDPMVALRCE